MTTEIATRTASNAVGFTRDQVDLIRRTLAPQATDDELALFIGHATRTGLDPFARQIFLVPRRQNVNGSWVEVHQTMVSIDGARLVAQRSAKYRGQTPPEWCGPDGAWRDVWLSDEPPSAARVAVVHADYPDRPVWGIARYSSYVQTVKDGGPNATWRRMPDVMLAKCAEMLALRKAFQQDLSGLVLEEESGTDPVVLDATGEHETPGAPLPRRKASPDEERLVIAAKKKARLTSAEFTSVLESFGVVGDAVPWSDQIPEILAAIEAHQPAAPAASADPAEDVPADQTELLP